LTGLNIDVGKVQEAKEKLGDRNAEIMVSLLGLKDYDEKNMKACSPYRDERTPSFIYDPKTYRFHDFGGDGITVDVVDVLMQQGNTYLQACKKLFEHAGIEYAFGEEGVKTRHQYKYPNETPLNEKKKVYEYLGKRGISKDTIDYLDIREDEHGNCVLNYYDTNDVLTMKKLRPARTIDKGKKEPKMLVRKGVRHNPTSFQYEPH